MRKKFFYILTINLFIFFIFIFLEVLLRINSQFEKPIDFYNSFGKSNFNWYNGNYCSWSNSLYPSPYFGFVHSKNGECLVGKVNDQFMIGPNFPDNRNEKYFDILVLGGSVAFNMMRDNFISKERGYLRKTLEDKFMSHDGRSIRVFSGAVGAWKQPNQLFFYQMYGDVFDGIISLEGVNEFSTLLEFDHYRPMDFTSFFIPFPEVENIFARIILEKFKPESFYVLIRIRVFLENYFKRRFDKEIKRSQYHDMYRIKQGDEKEKFEQRKKDYKRNLIMMSTIANHDKQKLAIFFQPLVDLKRNRTKEEARYVTGNKNYTYFYPLFVESVLKEKDLSQNRHFSLLDLFENENSRVYSDFVHFYMNNQGLNLGHVRMTDAIIKKLEMSWGIQLIKN